MNMVVFLLNGKSYKCCSSGFDPGLITSSYYINDVYKITDNDSKIVLFADGTSIKVTACNQERGSDGGIKLNG